MWANILLVLLAYFLGAFPFLYLLGRFRGFDLRKEEDMHLSLWRKVGHTEGLIGILWELFKGAIVVLVARWLDFRTEWVAGAGLAVAGGQMWPILFRFKGEHGNTTGFGVAAALAYWALPFALIPVVTGVAIKVIASLRESSKPMSERLQFSGAATWSMPLGMGLGFVAFPLASWGLKLDGWITLACLILLMLIIIKRLTDGLMEDLKIAPDKRSVLLNRLLYDRGYRQN